MSGLFYDYDKGPAQYEAPVGELTGEITSKWQYKIRGGNMVYEFESDVKSTTRFWRQNLEAAERYSLKTLSAPYKKSKMLLSATQKTGSL